MASSCYAESVATGEGRGGRSGRKFQLSQDVRDVAIDGVLAQNEPLGDVSVRETLGNQIEYLQLAPTQASEWGVDRFVGKPHARLSELSEHGLGTRALALRSQVPEVRDGGLDLAPGAVVAPERAQRLGEVKPDAGRLEAGIGG